MIKDNLNLILFVQGFVKIVTSIFAADLSFISMHDAVKNYE